MVPIQMGNVPRRPNGTALAILYESDWSLRDAPAARGWGGARNSASRTSNSLALSAALRLVEAAQLASSLRVPFNRHLTVHWEKGGITDAKAAGATGRLVKLISDWVARKGGRISYAWVRENGPFKGSHVHILLHIPKGVSLGMMTRRWAQRVMGKYPKGAVKTKAIGGTTGAAFTGLDWYQDNLASVVAYLLKGADRHTGETLDLDKFEVGGTVIGKRVSISQNLLPGRGGSIAPPIRQDSG